MEKLTITSITAPGGTAEQSLFFLESLRQFGGALGDSPCLFLAAHPADSFSDEELAGFKALGAEILSFELADEVRKFPFGALVAAAAAAEEYLVRRSELQVWLLADTLVVDEPGAFLLPEDISLAYRPVHHTLVGSVYDQPVDEFWAMVYTYCEVPEARVFPMETCVRDHVIRPYFNAGMLVSRPGEGLMRAWQERFLTLYAQPEMKVFYEQDSRYAIFIHQAVLAGAALNKFEQGGLMELPESINYPLHLHTEYHPDHKAARLDNLVTARYESLEELPGWLDGIEVGEELGAWLAARFAIEK